MKATTLVTIDKVTALNHHADFGCDDCGHPIRFGADIFETSDGAVYCSWECVTGKVKRRSAQPIRPDTGHRAHPGQQLGLLGERHRGGITGPQMTFGFPEPAPYAREARPVTQDDPGQLSLLEAE